MFSLASSVWLLPTLNPGTWLQPLPTSKDTRRSQGGSNGGDQPFGERKDQGGTHITLAASGSLEEVNPDHQLPWKRTQLPETGCLIFGWLNWRGLYAMSCSWAKHTSARVQGNENDAELANFKPVFCKAVNKQCGQRRICFTLRQHSIPNPNSVPWHCLVCLGTIGFLYLFVLTKYFKSGD